MSVRTTVQTGHGYEQPLFLVVLVLIQGDVDNKRMPAKSVFVFFFFNTTLCHFQSLKNDSRAPLEYM